MKKITFVLAILTLSLSVFAGGEKTKGLNRFQYNPNPSSGDVKSALNIYVGPGRVYRSNLGISIGGDFEIPVIDPNLTIGPGFGIGIHHYDNAYWVGSTYYSGTSQFSFYGGVVAHYYVDWLIPSMPDEFDVFITSNVGYGLVMYSDYYANRGYFDFGTSVGGRWNFADNMSLYAQTGYGNANFLIGLSFKF